MSMFLTGLSGFAATLAIAAGAIYVTEAKPRAEWRGGSGFSWTGEASAASAQPLKRVAAKPSFKPSTVVKHPEVSPVDRITTGALPDQKSEITPEPDVATTMAHVQWYSERYRSYRLENNSYRSYSGSPRECVSPFTSGSSTREEEEVDHADIGIDRPHGRYAVEEGPANFLTPRHIASCFARYRSYNPDDNSYQPYGGGSRRQCG